MRRATVSFDELVHEARHAVAGLLPPERINIVAPDDLPLLELDPVLIGQVLANLLENAARLSPIEGSLLVSWPPG